MTTINDISDLVQVLRDRPDWLAAVRSLVLGDELLDLPQQLARFVESTEENFRLAQEQTRQVQEQIRLIHQQLERLEGKAGNFEGAAYERRVRTRVSCDWSMTSAWHPLSLSSTRKDLSPRK